MPGRGSVARWERMHVMLRQLRALAQTTDTLDGKPGAAKAALQWHREANALQEWMGREITRATVDALAADRTPK